MSTMAPPTEVLAAAPVLAMSSSTPTPSSYSSPSSAIARNPSSSSVQPGSDANARANPHVNNPTLSLVPPTKPSSAAAAAAIVFDPTTTTTTTNTNTTKTTAATTATTTTTAANAILPAAVAVTTPATSSDVVPPINATATTATPVIPTVNSRPSVITTTATSSPRPIPVPSSKTVHSDLSASPSHSPVNISSNYSSSQTPVESLRRHPTDLTHPIPEECDEETCSESLPNDPVTPVSGRQSRDFRFCDSHEFYHRDSVADSLTGAHLGVPVAPDADVPVSPTDKRYLQPVPPSTSHASATENSATSIKKVVTQPEHILAIPTNPRPIARRSSSALSRAMSSLFRRSYHHVDENGAMLASKTPSYGTGASETSLAPPTKNPAQPSRRRFSYHRSSATTRSNSPPSPASPIEAVLGSQGKTDTGSMPTSRDFLENSDKKHRTPTGFSLRQRVNFVGTTKGPKSRPPRRARSLERKTTSSDEEHLTRQPWAIPPEAGTGMKARRLSLSLPDDFTLDIAELHKEFEYQHKFLGRHGKHLGKGATSKVTLMVRKGCPGELYAAKEFRSRSASETPEEYEKKIKSEYSIAKSLHHPNVVETIRLCTDHGRWNHVMEYCSEGDLFGLVSKKYLKEEGRDVDRLCLFKQLCQGINYLHKNGIAHRDIKLENLLITKDSKLKITDFGVSEVFTGMHPGLRESGGQCGVAMGEVRLCKPGICGSLPYIAPEVLSKKADYDPRPLDVWSSAIVMIYLIFSANLWEKAEAGLPGPSQRYYNDLVAGWAKTDAKKEAKPEEAKDAYPKIAPLEYFVKPLPLRRLLLNMLHPNPEKRITMNDVVTNRWMKNVECCQLESYDDPVKFIDASKKDCMKSTNGKIFCHNHLPLVSTGHGLPPMPGKPGY